MLKREILIALGLGLSLISAWSRGEKSGGEVRRLSEKFEQRTVLSIPDSCHTQGMALDEEYLYLSCCELRAKQAWIYRIPRAELVLEKSGKGLSYEKLNISLGAQYHPSGLDIRDNCLWVAVAEYHPAPASSSFICIERGTFQVSRSQGFSFPDHIGALATGEKWILALNWDARVFYLFDYSGKLLGKRENPTGIAYQDCKYYKEGKVLCSGPRGKLGLEGFVDLIDLSDNKAPKLLTRIEVPGLRKLLMPLTREAMAIVQEKVYFLPQDFPNPVLYQFELGGGFE